MNSIEKKQFKKKMKTHYAYWPIFSFTKSAAAEHFAYWINVVLTQIFTFSPQVLYHILERDYCKLIFIYQKYRFFKGKCLLPRFNWYNRYKFTGSPWSTAWYNWNKYVEQKVIFNFVQNNFNIVKQCIFIHFDDTSGVKMLKAILDFTMIFFIFDSYNKSIFHCF